MASRRRALAAITSVLAAMALAAAVAGRSCRVDENTPTGAVRAFAAASRADDRDALYELFGPQTRAGLDVAAKRATDLAGGSMRYGALDMISVGRPSHAIRDLTVTQRSESRAIVALVDSSGRRSQITVVYHDGRWLIELPEYDGSR